MQGGVYLDSFANPMAGQRIGYIRVSTLDQQIERQLDGIALDETFTDKASGKDAKRPQLEQLLRFARTGDTVLVHSMDRLARNLDDLRRIVHILTGKGVRIEFVKEQLTFTGEDSPMANLLLSVMGAFAEFERALIHERQREGIALAKQRGPTRDARRPSPPRPSCSCARALRRASARPKSPGSLASAGKPSINIGRKARASHSPKFA
jgi:DNA invertase Pin-like site-specific DNA recombinase